VKLLAALALPAALAFALMYAGVQLIGNPEPRPHEQASGIVWGDRVFVNRTQLARWLRSRGVDYLVWARRHPVRAGLEPPSPSRPPQARADSAAGIRWTRWLTGATALAAGIGLLLLLRRLVRAGLLRRATEVGRASCGQAGTAVLVAWHERRDLGWYVAGALLVAGGALVATGWS
jgi:hypothetical protein